MAVAGVRPGVPGWCLRVVGAAVAEARAAVVAAGFRAGVAILEAAEREVVGNENRIIFERAR